MMIPIPYEGSSNIDIFILDKQVKKIVYHSNDFIQDKDPFKVSSSQLKDLLNDFWKIEDE